MAFETITNKIQTDDRIWVKLVLTVILAPFMFLHVAFAMFKAIAAALPVETDAARAERRRIEDEEDEENAIRIRREEEDEIWRRHNLDPFEPF